jgi:hypothetical protein
VLDRTRRQAEFLRTLNTAKVDDAAA